MPVKENRVKLVAVGDVMFSSAGMFDHCRDLLVGADIAFGQLEQVLSDKGAVRPFSSNVDRARYPAGVNHARPVMPHIAPEEGVQLLVDAGFDVMSFASNHTMHHGEEGMLDTIDLVQGSGVRVVGAGKNIDEAVKPAVLTRKGTKIGLLAYCSVVIPGDEATPFRGGVAPLRATTCYQQIDWQPGAPPKVLSKANPDDMAGMVADIKKLRSRVDVLIVSMHWGVHFVPGYVCDYQFELAHAAIDAGADMIIGHHAHILKGVEVYHGKVIFYSLCNFSSTAAGFAVGKFQKMTGSKRCWLDVFGYRFEVDPTSPIYGYPADAKKTMLVKVDIDRAKVLRASYIPLWINALGEPEPVKRTDPRFDEHYDWMEWMCGSQGLDTHFKIEGDEVVICTDS